jgi:hypothetical protein
LTQQRHAELHLEELVEPEALPTLAVRVAREVGVAERGGETHEAVLLEELRGKVIRERVEVGATVEMTPNQYAEAFAAGKVGPLVAKPAAKLLMETYNYTLAGGYECNHAGCHDTHLALASESLRVERAWTVGSVDARPSG